MRTQAVALVELTAYVATVLAAVGVLPQLRRLLRDHDLAGVSLTWATLGVTSEAGWTAYTVNGHLWAAVPEVVLMVAVYVVLAGVMIRAGAQPRGAVIAASAWAGILIAVWCTTSPAAFGTVLGASYAVQVAPSIWTAYRTWAPSGVAPGTWTFILAECLLWGVYGVAHRAVAIAVFAMVGTVAASSVLIRCSATRGRLPQSGGSARLTRLLQPQVAARGDAPFGTCDPTTGIAATMETPRRRPTSDATTTG